MPAPLFLPLSTVRLTHAEASGELSRFLGLLPRRQHQPPQKQHRSPASVLFAWPSLHHPLPSKGRPSGSAA